MVDEAHEEGQLPFPHETDSKNDPSAPPETWAQTQHRLNEMDIEHDDDTSWVPGHQPLEKPTDGFERSRRQLEAPHDRKLDYPHDEVA